MKAACEQLVSKGQALNLKAKARVGKMRILFSLSSHFLVIPLFKSPRKSSKIGNVMAVEFHIIALVPFQQVNPDIIGGLVVDIGDKHMDLSLNTRIRKMEQLLAETV